MQDSFNPIRYSVIEEKNPREIVMLIGNGCKWRKCTFCDYHLDSSADEEENYKINKNALSQVTGRYNRLEVINSGSFVDLDKKTMELIKEVCLENCIDTIHFECHWMHRDEIESLRESFENIGVTTVLKLGLETFDYNMREDVLKKGLDEKNPQVIAEYFDEINLLQGIKGQTAESMINDIETGLLYFDRVCVNVMTENTTKVKPDENVIDIFKMQVYPKYVTNKRVDILMENTDFGVGENQNE
jgi:hypothetical protein